MTPRDPLAQIVRSLTDAHVRFVVIGVTGVNYYAHSAAVVFRTYDRDLFLPADPKNLVTAWDTCEQAGLTLWCNEEPLDSPRDAKLARAVVDRRSLTQATDGEDLHLDLTLVMAGFDFADVWRERQTFVVDGVEVPVARLSDIVESKARVGRKKDLLFLETHKEALRQMLGSDPDAD